MLKKQNATVMIEIGNKMNNKLFIGNAKLTFAMYKKIKDDIHNYLREYLHGCYESPRKAMCT